MPATELTCKDDGLLGMPGAGGLPLWLDPEKFLHDNFSSELVVAELRRFVSCKSRAWLPQKQMEMQWRCKLLSYTCKKMQVPLPSLQSELESYLASLKTKVMLQNMLVAWLQRA